MSAKSPKAAIGPRQLVVMALRSGMLIIMAHGSSSLRAQHAVDTTHVNHAPPPGVRFSTSAERDPYPLHSALMTLSGGRWLGDHGGSDFGGLMLGYRKGYLTAAIRGLKGTYATGYADWDTNGQIVPIDFKQLSALVGLTLVGSGASVAICAGVSHVWGRLGGSTVEINSLLRYTGPVTPFNTWGFPVLLQVIYFFKDALGVGIEYWRDYNTLNNLAGGSCTIQWRVSW
jgi:hypothetical protein